MNRRKSISLLCAAVLAVTALCACANTPSYGDVKAYTEGMAYTETEKGEALPVYKLTYDVFGGEDVMPIGGFYTPYASGGSTDGNDAADFLTEDIFGAIEECGINTMFYSVDRWTTGARNENIVKALDLCAEHNMAYYVSCYFIMAQTGSHYEDFPLEDMVLLTPQGKQTFRNIVEAIKGSSEGARRSFVGFVGQDEPFPSELDNLGVVREAFYGLDNTAGLDIYGNALGYWAGEDNLYGYSDPIAYDAYIKQYFEQFGPKMLSVTQYPYTSEKTPDSTLTALLYDKLSHYRVYANRYQVPFWRMLQAGGQWNDIAAWVESKPAYPSEGELLLDVNMSLAYGAKAIQYFPLIQPIHFAYETGGKYDYVNRNGLIGADGNKTRWFYYAKRANTQIKAIDEYLMNAASAGVLVHGKNAVQTIIESGDPGENVQAEGSFRQLTSVTGDDCVVGLFDYRGGTALYAVNASRTDKADVTLSFDRSSYRYTVVQRGQSCDVVGGKMTLTLDAGEGALVVLH